MKVLLDTCALIWLVSDQSQLSPRSKHLISTHWDELYVSVISALEIGIKTAKGRLELSCPLAQWWTRAIEQHGLIVVPADAVVLIASTTLPAIHGDPADRIIIATAVNLGAVIITSDQYIAQYPQATVEW